MPKNNKSERVKLIANPGAGNVLEAAQRLEDVTRCLLEHGFKVDVALAKPKKKAIPIVRKAIKDGYGTIIAMGGDGTIWSVMQGVLGSKAQLGIIPAGTANDIAESLGIPNDLQEACALIASGHTRRLDLAEISTKQKKKSPFLITTTVGLTATIYPHLKEVPEGKFSGVKDAITTFLKFEPNPRVSMLLDDERQVEVETMLVLIVNTPLIALRNLVAPDAKMDDGLLDIAVFPGFTKAELLAYFAKTANERRNYDQRIQHYQASRIKIKTSPKLDMATEGLMVGKGSAKIKVLPRALRVIAPEPGSGAEKPRTEIAENRIPVSMPIDANNHIDEKVTPVQQKSL